MCEFALAGLCGEFAGLCGGGERRPGLKHAWSALSGGLPGFLI